MVLSTKLCFPLLPEANNLKPAHAKSFYDLLSEDAIKQEQDVTHLKCIKGAKYHFHLTRINH
jgi:hypothetical protein